MSTDAFKAEWARIAADRRLAPWERQLPWGVYRHFKGGLYVVQSLAVEDHQTGPRIMVVYAPCGEDAANVRCGGKVVGVFHSAVVGGDLAEVEYQAVRSLGNWGMELQWPDGVSRPRFSREQAPVRQEC